MGQGLIYAASIENSPKILLNVTVTIYCIEKYYIDGSISIQYAVEQIVTTFTVSKPPDFSIQYYSPVFTATLAACVLALTDDSLPWLLCLQKFLLALLCFAVPPFFSRVSSSQSPNAVLRLYTKKRKKTTC